MRSDYRQETSIFMGTLLHAYLQCKVLVLKTCLLFPCYTQSLPIIYVSIMLNDKINV